MMKMHQFIGLTTLWALIAGSCPAAAQAIGRNASSAESTLDLSAALGSKSPHPSLGDQAQVFSHLLGTWDVKYLDILKDGKRRQRTGVFVMGWVMDGRAIQDLWIVDPSPGHVEREIYTDVRYFDPKTHSWPAIFVDPEHASMSRFSGGTLEDGRIVLQTSDLGSQPVRWSFEDIEPNSFVFRDEALGDDGMTWKLQSEYHMKRRSAITLP